MNIFQKVNNLTESVIALRLGLTEALDKKSFECPICGHGKHGDGIKQSHFKNRLVWHCYGACGSHWTSNTDFIAAVEKIDVDNKAELAKRLEELFPSETSDSFSFQGKTFRKPEEVQTVSAGRNFAAFYKRCRINYSLKKFVDKCGGHLRGLTYETLSAAKCMYHPEYTYNPKKPPAPVIIVPYDDELFYWRRLDEVPEGEPKGGVPSGTRRKPYIAAPLALGTFNLIVEGELDALSIWQVLKNWGIGIIATGGAQFFRPTVAEIQRQFREPNCKLRFIVLYDNDAAGAKHGDTLTAALRAAKFPTEQFYFACRMEGEYTGAHGVKMYQPKIDANDLLREGEEILIRRLVDIVDSADVWLDMQAEKLGRQKS